MPRLSLRFLHTYSRARAVATMPPPAEALPPRAGLALNDPNLLGGGSFVDGAFCRARSTTPDLIVTNPANGGVVRRVGEAADEDVKRALDAAGSAFAKWRHVSLADRAAFLRRWHDLLLAHREDLSRLITLENGKPLSEAGAELDYAASFLDWAALLPARAPGTSAVHRDAAITAITTTEPVGVCLLVTPWNFPAAMLTRKAAPAIAAGCAVVAKPSELTPLTALALAELARRAGAPPGLFNVVASSRPAEVVGLALASSAVRMVSFTGSTRVGKLIAAEAAARVVRASLELGGHAPFIVFEDADIDAAVDGLVRNKFRVAGQTCIAANRVFVQRGATHDVFVDRLRARMSRLVIGNGLDPSVDLGPLISETAMRRVTRHVEDAVRRGATLVLGGREAPVENMANGHHGGGGEDAEQMEGDDAEFVTDNFFPPTLLTGVTDNMTVAQEETFGPVVGVLGFVEEAEVLRRANGKTKMGLAAYVYTRDGGRAVRATRELQYGMVGVNCVDISNAATPFGGMKESGLGREGGVGALDPYTEVKHSLLRF